MLMAQASKLSLAQECLVCAQSYAYGPLRSLHTRGYDPCQLGRNEHHRRTKHLRLEILLLCLCLMLVFLCDYNTFSATLPRHVCLYFQIEHTLAWLP